MRLRLTSMTAGLAAGVTVAVTLASAAGAYLYSVHHFDSLLESARGTALAQGRLMRAALEHQMMENDRSLIERMVRTFSQETRVERVMIVDRTGHLQYTNDPQADSEIHLDSPTCQACHRLPPEERTASRVIETREGKVLRTVIPLPNRKECHACHDPKHRINGVLIVDHSAGEILAMMNRDLRWMALGTGALALLLVVALAILLRFVVTRRLQRFETTARLIAAGDLERRVPVKGSDTLAWLGQEFNAMADTMTDLLKEVRDQREQLEAVINGIDDGIVVLDVDRRVIAANDAFLRRSGRTRELLIGSSCHDSVTDACGAADCATEACLRTGESQIRICERRSAGGEVILEEVHASPIGRRSGGVGQIVEVWRDITERRAAEAHLAESHRLASLGLLASGFSHELNTPLATILTCVESIQRTARRDKNGGATAVRRIENSASIAREQLLRCRGITQHFLRLARGQDSKTHLVDLEATLAAVMRLVEPTACSHSVDVRMGPVPEGLHVRVNESEFQHVVLNLLLNAIEACDSGGRVDVDVSDGDPVRVLIRDNGPGIAPENQKRIFEPFFSGRSGGTGLGLFLALDFARRWGGNVRLESAPGRGATFEVSVPPASGAGRLRTAR